MKFPFGAQLYTLAPAMYRPSGPSAISHGLGHSFVWMVPITLQSMSNIFTKDIA